MDTARKLSIIKDMDGSKRMVLVQAIEGHFW